ncbi:MAG: PD-(D/E)XK nuclease family protein, partial [Phycisphaerales bacterium JB039]
MAAGAPAASCDRVFLGWDRPALHSAADWLWAHAADGDLSHLRLITPGARAGRVLLALLAERAQAGGGALAPPGALTAGNIAELAQPPARLASPTAQRVAWIEALRGLDEDALSAICGPKTPATAPAWDALARLVQRASAELAAQGLSLADVPARAGALPLDPARWEALGQVESRYHRLLDAHALADPGAWAMRLARQPPGPGADRPAVVLVGVAELGAVARAILGGFALSALVAAPESLADRFDALGCIIPEAWNQATIAIDDNRLIFCADPRDEARCAAAAIARNHADRPAGAITIGAPEGAAIAPLRRSVRDGLGVSARAAAGRKASLAPIGRLLERIGAFLETGRFRDFAALVRSPLLEEALLAGRRRAKPEINEWWLERLDAFQRQRHPRRIGHWGAEEARLADLERRVRRLLRPLEGPPRPAGAWAGPIGDCLQGIVARTAAPDGAGQRQRLAEARLIGSALTEMAQLGALAPQPLTASEAIQAIIRRLGDLAIPEDAGGDCVEILGWLELPLDPAPALVITGLTEQALGGGGAGGLLAPAVRRALGLPDDPQRLARNAHALATILGTRPDATLLCPRRDADGNPLTPSRLLLMADPQTVARRVLRFTGDEAAEGPPRIAMAPCGDTCAFWPAPIMAPKRAALQTMPVTGFAAYLQSRYRFYLGRVMRAEPLDDSAREMDPLVFGSLLHAVLERFGRSELTAETNPHRIEAHCAELLQELALQRFGASPPAPVWVQLDMARRRLSRFAHLQAERARAGWRII